MRTVFLAILLVAVLLLAGCVSDTRLQDASALQQRSYNAAASLPPSPQTTAIMANAVTTGELVGYPITQSATAPAIPGSTP